jgi:esterase/lipase superfamily enzyme
MFLLKEEYHKWNTQYLSREFEMLVFGYSGFPVIIFPTSRGRYFENKDFGLINSAAGLINSGIIKIYCPDGIDSESWYNYSIHPADRVKTHNGYENVILNDVIEFAKHETGRDRVAVAGCSFGAFHALNIAFRHPDKIKYLICMGGAYNIKQFIMGFYDDNCYFNNPPDYIPNLNDHWFLEKLRNMGIVLGTGEHDICLKDNLEMSDMLNRKGIQHWLDIRPGAKHDWPDWKIAFPDYLSQIHG